MFSDPTVDFKTPTFGNVGPHIFSGPNSFYVDAALFRNIRVSERFNLQFRSDWFSALNVPQFNNPGLSFGSSSFGFITGAGRSRCIDFGLKLLF